MDEQSRTGSIETPASVTVVDDHEGRPTELDPGSVVARYVVLARLGAGGMGVVYAAYDPALDRKVALKLLRWDTGNDDEAKARLLREAHALAKLSHPHVVTLYDVGEHEDRIWLAMEFVDGETFSTWLGRRKRSHHEVLALMVRAGQGLAAAHTKSLVHRDFKPDNVMVAADGRVRVMDFGLASLLAAEERPPSASTLADADPLSSNLTRNGAVIGTPPYMAPEQHLGLPTDPRTDQFSFCVALWEGLYGERPFDGETMAALAYNVTHGNLRRPPRSTVPRWLRQTLERGLATDPDRRWPSMDTLLRVLDEGRSRARRRRSIVMATVVVTTIGGVMGWQQIDRSRGETACVEDGASIDRIWNPEVRDEIGARFAATGIDHAYATWERTVPWIERYASTWRNARAAVCRQSTLEGSLAVDLADRARSCLDDRAVGLATALEAFSNLDRTALQHAVMAIAELDPIEPCTTTRELERTVRRDPSIRGTVIDIERRLARAQATEAAGAYDAALEQALSTLEDAHKIGELQVVAAAEYRVGTLRARLWSYETAASHLERAFLTAGRAGRDVLAVEAASRLANLHALQLGRIEDGSRWAKLGEMLLSRIGEENAGLAAASLWTGFGDVDLAAKEYDEALERYGRALAIRRRLLGDEHPASLRSLQSIAYVQRVSGDHGGSLSRYREALAMAEQIYGGDHPMVAQCHDGIAHAHEAAGRLKEALGSYRQVLEIHERVLGPNHAMVAAALDDVARLHEAVADLPAAERVRRRQLTVLESAFGPDNEHIASTIGNLGRVLAGMERWQEALELHRRELAIRRHSSPPDDDRLAEPLTGIGIAELGLGRPRAAVVVLEQALTLREAKDAAPHELAETRFALARALASSGGDERRVIELANLAERGYRQAEPLHRQALAAVEAWRLRSQPP